MTGRARGRGVARGRGTAQPAATAQPPRTPGAPPGTGAPTQSAPTPQRAAGDQPGVGGGNGNGGNGVGRAAQRGGARGTSVTAQVETGMQNLSLGQGDASNRRGKRDISFNEPNTRPAHLADKRGTYGNPIPLLCNYFKLTSSTDTAYAMYQYHVDFNPPMDSKKLRQGLLGNHGNQLFSNYLFDGMQLFSPTKLPDEVTEVFSTRKFDDAKIRITLKRTAELASNSPICIQIFNIMMRKILSDLGMKEIQRAYYSPSGAIRLQNHRLEVWPGYRTSILQYEEDIMLNIDVSHKVLRTDSVLDAMYKMYAECRQNLAAFKDMATKKLTGQIVLTRYNDKTYRIDDIEWDVHPPMTFSRKAGEISYVEYYKQAYNIQVRDQQQPMLVSRPKKKDQREGAPELLYLLPELCTMTGLTDEMRNNFKVMKDLGVHTKVDPTRRAQTMNSFRQDIERNTEVQQRLTGWGVKFSRELAQLSGRSLPPEKIIVGPERGQAKTVSAGNDADWGRSLRGKLYTTVSLHSWVIVFAQDNKGNAENFAQNLNRVAPPMGIEVNRPRWVSLHNGSTSAFLEGVRVNTDPSVQMMVCVLPTNKKELYDAIKKQCCIESPVPSQCVTNAKLSNPKGLMSVVSKIAIQLNCKLGGEAWALEVPLSKLMVVGIDTYHDSSKKGKSVGGFVASLNTTLTRYYSQSTSQTSHQELIDSLKVTMVAALKKYHSINGALPERIIVYRDGVGDGQLPAVVEHEIRQLIEAMPMLGTNYNPKLTVIVVKKRINSRFFAKAGNNLANPGPGTIIDSVATRPESYDFFVVSQSVREGTVTPTHYNIIWDTSGLKPDHLQRLTYKLCHLYYNWPGTIRVPAPCQYAHKLAFLTGQSLHRSHHSSLSDKLFYL